VLPWPQRRTDTAGNMRVLFWQKRTPRSSVTGGNVHKASTLRRHVSSLYDCPVTYRGLLGTADLIVPLKLFQGQPLSRWQQNLGYFRAEWAHRAHRAVIFAIAQLLCLIRVLFSSRGVHCLIAHTLRSIQLDGNKAHPQKQPAATGM